MIRKIQYLQEDVKTYWVPLLKYRLEQYFGRMLWRLKDSNICREVFPPMRNMVYVRQMRGAELVMEDFGWNVRTNQGADWQCNRMGQAPATGTTIANFINIHNSSGYVPASGDTQVANWQGAEVTGSGFSRLAGGYLHTGGTATYTLSANFTCTGAPVTGYGAGLLDAAPSGGNLFCVRNFGTPATMAVNDTLAVTWSISV